MRTTVPLWRIGKELRKDVNLFMKKIDILIAGVGGQGTILTGNVISRLALKENLDVKTAETHGMAQRGGSVVNHVRIGEKVYSPLIPKGSVDYLLSFEKLEALRYLPFLSAGGTVIVNKMVLAPLPVLTGQEEYPEKILDEIKSNAHRTIIIDALQHEPVKTNAKVLNVFLIGVLASLLPFSRESWKQTMEETIPQKFLDLNLKAFSAGYKWTENLNQDSVI